ncbi:outer membrane channel protein TolC [Vibrio spartinae]|uniref:Outer membrane protein TolC n=1 Tax=Vibrio spartinae TaxID=1918945 RepID=A0A1N6M442_9VIBR|nr:outer membrane channel protein TolC [Vibrio spartinae]QMV13307.1 Outer membrane protein TolC precursor [Vibrio spartinae]SIO94188.1 Outer membrane protein TolC precursor [Vibrio spartinae]
MKKLLPLCVSITLGSLSPIVWADTLADIYDQAKQNDPQLLSAAAQRDSAYEAIKSTRGELLPQINLSTGYNIISSNKDVADSKQWSAGVTLSQALYDRNSWLNLGIAEKSARQVDSQYAQTQQNLILRVAQAYFEVLRAKDNLAFVRAEKNAVARQLEQTKQRFEVGLSAITDVHDAQAQYDSVLADEVLAENSLTNSYEAIREITGQEPHQLSSLDTERFSASKMDQTMTELVNEAQKKNLSLLTARISQDIAREKIALASSGHLPSLSLDAGYSTKHEYEQSNANYDAFDPINNVSVGVNLSVPLYTGGKITAETKQAEYGLTQASEDLEASYRSVVKNVRAYNNNINASIGAIRAYQQAVVSAKSALQATEAGFDVGTRTIVDVLDSTRRLYDANRNLSDARYDYILNVLQLKQSVGTLNEQDILAINAGLK